MNELGAVVKRKLHELDEAGRKFDKLRETLGCTWRVIRQDGGGISFLLNHLYRKCKFSQKALLLLAINDEATPMEERKHEFDDSNIEGTAEDTLPSPSHKEQIHRHSHGEAGNSGMQHWLLG